MTTISKIKLLISLVAISVVFFGNIGDVLAGKSCGHNYPDGCPEGKECKEVILDQWVQRGSGMAARMVHQTSKSYECHEIDKKNEKIWGGDISYSTAGDGPKITEHNYDSGIGVASKTLVDEKGGMLQSTTVGGFITVSENDYGYEPLDSLLSNDGFCRIDQLKKDYTSNCYSCLIVANLIRTFMNAIDSTYNVTQVAGIKLLSIGMILWLAFFVINKLSSFVSIEPMDMLQELFTFFFKCLIAYTLITSGLKTLTTLIINPILIVGADYGIAVADAVLPEGMKGISEHNDKNSYKLTNSSVMDTEVFDKIMTLSKKADAAVSTNFVIGEALICHSIHAGAINITESVEKVIPVKFYFPDVWIWLCGAVIWFFAFMVVMGVNFYLLDLSFKIGFAILAMPVMIGLWPFNKFKDKFKSCVNILINAAGTFMFLGITTGLSVLIISAALGGTEELFAAIASDDKGYVSQRFSLGGGSFIIILFAFLYAHKLISKTEGLTDKFFESDMKDLNSMHHMTTQMIDFAKKQVGETLSLAGALVTGGASAAVKTAGKQMAREAIRKARDIGKKKNKEKND